MTVKYPMGALALSAIRKLVSDGAADLSLDCHDCCSTHVVRKRGLHDEDILSECSFDSGSVSTFSTSSKEMQSVIYVDSRARTSGSDSNFEIELRESLHLSDHGVRLDSIRFTNSFLTTDLGRHVYYKDGAGGNSYFILGLQAYTGTQLAAALQSSTGRPTSYSDLTNTITQAVTTGQEWLSDAELATYSSGFPAGASASAPQSINQILGESRVNAITGDHEWHFVKMAPYDYAFLRSRRLTFENSHDPRGRHDVIATVPLTQGIGLVETGQTPDGVYHKLPRDLVLRTIDFQLTDYLGNALDLRGRPLSFKICLD